jgi:hypothetical protein
MGTGSESQAREQPGELPPSPGRPRKFLRLAFSGQWPVWLIGAATFDNGVLSILLALLVQFPQGARPVNGGRAPRWDSAAGR